MHLFLAICLQHVIKFLAKYNRCTTLQCNCIRAINNIVIIAGIEWKLFQYDLDSYRYGGFVAAVQNVEYGFQSLLEMIEWCVFVCVGRYNRMYILQANAQNGISNGFFFCILYCGRCCCVCVFVCWYLPSYAIDRIFPKWKWWPLICHRECT